MDKTWWTLPLGVLLGLLCAGLVLLAAKPERSASVLLRPPPTPAPMVIDIDGKVRDPGVYHLPVNSRVQDAVQAAGGFAPGANSGAVNLAAFLEDGDHVLIPGKGEQPSPKPLVDQEFVLSPTPTSIRFPININTADQQELEALPGIGPVTAEKIIAYRRQNEFLLIEEIQKVPGIGPATFENIQDLITVGQ